MENKMRCYIDIETIPTQNQAIIDSIRASIRHPGNITKQESIDKWYAENSAIKFDEVYRKTSFDGLYGEVLSISWAIEDSEVFGLIRRDYDTELDLLTEFFTALVNYQDKHGQRTAISKWIGHYVSGFDLRFIWQRCVMNKYKPPIDIPFNAKPWDDCIFDTKMAWTGPSSQYNGASKLGDMCIAFGMDGKLDDMDGSKVYDYWLEDRLDEILAYNKDDVVKTRALYKLMTFQDAVNAVEIPVNPRIEAETEVKAAEQPKPARTRKPKKVEAEEPAQVIEPVVDTETGEILVAEDYPWEEPQEEIAVADPNQEWLDRIAKCASLADISHILADLKKHPDLRESLIPAIRSKQEAIRSNAEGMAA
jgi:hypothetical protein